jgi:hypothetical protein
MNATPVNVQYSDDGAGYGPDPAKSKPNRFISDVIAKGSYSAGFGLSFVGGIIGALIPRRAAQPVEPAPEDDDGVSERNLPAVRQPAAGVVGREIRPAGLRGMILTVIARLLAWVRFRAAGRIAGIDRSANLSITRQYGAREYALVTIAYWGITVTDGAIRMLVLFQFYLMGYSAFQIASLFLLYEIFGVITNLFGGWIGANMGLRVTLFGGMAIQILSLVMLALLNPAWSTGFVVAYVMVTQALSGIAKDLTKMSSKSAIKVLIPQGADAMMYRWVSLLTGSKNALKGVGFFVGALLLTLMGFNLALLAMGTGLSALLAALWGHLPGDLGKTRQKQKFKSMFSMDRRINVLSAARFFLFGARDVWFVVALPVYLSATFGWSPIVVGAYLALWTIGYGIVQSLAPKFVAAKKGETPKGYTLVFWAAVLAAVPAAIALALAAGMAPGLSIVGGLAVFGVIFAINSAVHSYMIVYYSESEKIAMSIGFYYMANAGGRLIGTLLSGWIYQVAGLTGCLWVSAIFVGTATLISIELSLPAETRRLPRPEIDGPLQVAF